MNNPKGFLQIEPEGPQRRDPKKRVKDWKEVYKKSPVNKVQQQAERCMNCGVAFCHFGCPLGNLIPEWNELVYNNKWHEAYERLSRTNNFPEFTGVLCPAFCEPSCVLAVHAKPVTIKQIELAIIDKAFSEGWVKPIKPKKRTGYKVAIIGSGPAGLAAAQELNWKGHLVTVFERDNRIGGLLRYGIPEFKMEKWRIDRRLKILEAEGIVFKPNVNIGIDISGASLLKQFDAVVLAIGARKPRDLGIPGRELNGIYFAMDYLTAQNRALEKSAGVKPYHPRGVKAAEGKQVVVIGGGDTGSDCIGTALRQGAKSVIQLQYRPQPPLKRTQDNPWPEWPRVFTMTTSHEEGGKRRFAVLTKEFTGKNGKVTGIKAARSEEKVEKGARKVVEIPGSDFIIPADIIFLAMGYSGVEPNGLVEQLDLELSPRGAIVTDKTLMTSRKGVFASGDCHRGQSLIVWAIAEGRRAAEQVSNYLSAAKTTPLFQ